MDGSRGWKDVVAGLLDSWSVPRQEGERRGALGDALPELGDAVVAVLDGGEPPPPLCAERVHLGVYAPGEVVAELIDLRETLLARLSVPADDPAREALVRLFDREILAVVRLGDRRAVEAPRGDGDADDVRKDTQMLPPDGRNPIRDAVFADRATVQRRRRLFEERAVMLAEASQALSRSIKYDDTLHAIARIVLRTLADWTIVDALDANGRMRRLAMHRDPAKAALIAELERDYVPGDATRGVPSHVLRTRQSLLIPYVTDAHYESTARSPRHEVILRALGSQSYMAVPMIVRDEIVGAITVVSSTAAPPYDQDDVIFAEEISSRAALALENAILYQRSLKAIQVRDDFLNIVSHDLKSPLQAIDMSAHVLERTPVEALGDRRPRKLIATIRSSSQRMRSLINDLLDLSRIEAGRLDLARRRERVAPIVVDVLQVFEPLAAGKDVRLESSGAGDVLLFAERDRIYQALANLVSNAVKFTPAGGRVAIDWRAVDGEVRIEVSDTGIGIAPEDLPHLFDRYWQADDHTRRGTGLGLSIAKAMVEAHGGRIDVESRRGQGSRFILHFPQSVEQETTTRDRAPDPEPATAG